MSFELKMGVELGRAESKRYQTELIRVVTGLQTHDGRIAVLPESALSAPTVERFWTRALTKNPLTVVAGAYVIAPDGYENVMLALSANGGDRLCRQRVPVPGSMWQPWQSWAHNARGARAGFFANPSVRLGDMQLAR